MQDQGGRGGEGRGIMRDDNEEEQGNMSSMLSLPVFESLTASKFIRYEG